LLITQLLWNLVIIFLSFFKAFPRWLILFFSSRVSCDIVFPY